MSSMVLLQLMKRSKFSLTCRKSTAGCARAIILFCFSTAWHCRIGRPYRGCTNRAALERKDLSCTCLAHHESENLSSSTIIVNTRRQACSAVVLSSLKCSCYVVVSVIHSFNPQMPPHKASIMIAKRHGLCFSEIHSRMSCPSVNYVQP